MNEKELVSFGNFLSNRIKTQVKQELESIPDPKTEEWISNRIESLLWQVSHADLENWKEENKRATN